MGSFTTAPMIFVTGASRSGTTMVTRILGRHSAIAGLEEMHYFGEFCDPRRNPPTTRIDRRDAVAKLLARQNEGILASRARPSSDADVQRILDTIPADAGAAEIFAVTMAAFAARSGKDVPCEQTPRNIYYARALLEWYPRARFVHMLRDPRAVMASQKFRWQRRSLLTDPSKMSRVQQLRTWVNYHPYTVTQLWTLATRLALELEDHPRFRLLRLEDLLLEPERRMRELCGFLGVDLEPGMLDIAHVNSSYVSTAGSARGLSRDTIDAWRGRLTADERAVVYERCSGLMERVGYQAEPGFMSRRGRVTTNARYLAHLAGAALVNPRRLWIQGNAMLRASVGTAPAERNGGAGKAEGYADPASHPRRVRVFGLPCEDVPLVTAARHLVACAAEGLPLRVFFVNAHSLNVAVREPLMRRALDGADIIYADGVGMAVAALLQGERLSHNVNGTDLFPHLCSQAAAAGVRVALLGAAPGVVDAVAGVLAERHPTLNVAWRHHGFMAPEDTDRLIDDINRSDAGILLVAMGVPRQELWIAKHGPALRVPVVMGVGGLFDFVSGRVPRAPLALRKLRMEWLFRLLVEPRRLFGRYVIGNPAFLARACRYAMTGHLSSSSRGATSR
jgi:N-acetylglucosaminyldiphosphoundecaprenol N-acetyl-beta-D-mannosaminyltransferase